MNQAEQINRKQALRAQIILMRFKGIEQKEIAKALNIHVTTVSTYSCTHPLVGKERNKTTHLEKIIEPEIKEPENIPFYEVKEPAWLTKKYIEYDKLKQIN